MTQTKRKLVYRFDEGSANMRDLLGGKGVVMGVKDSIFEDILTRHKKEVGVSQDL